MKYRAMGICPIKKNININTENKRMPNDLTYQMLNNNSSVCFLMKQ